MNLSDNFQLEIWKGDWGLPSIDINCLKVLSYAKFSNIPLTVKVTNNPFRSPSRQLPVLENKGDRFYELDKVFDALNESKHIPDDGSSRLQNGETWCYETMIEECIYPALQHLWWVDKQNLNQVIRPWYCKALSFPFNFYYPGKYEKHANFMMEVLYPIEDDKIIEMHVYTKAKECMNTLSLRLGESDYFFGSVPTMFDAIVFSNLAPLLKIPLPNCSLQNHLKGCTNLVKFINRILQRYFEDDYKEYEKSKSKDQEQKSTNNSDIEFPNKRRNQIFAGIIAVIAMLGYALSTGIVQVEVNDYDSTEYSYIDDDENDD